MALGREIASLTPSDPETIETAGLLAAIIHCVAGGLSIGDALERCRGLSSSSLGRVIDLASQGGRPRPRGGPAIDDALADRDTSAQMFGVALACALHASDVAAGIEAAWPLGDQGSATRSTLGWIAGSLLGAERGLDEVPPAFIERLDAADVVLAVAHDCASWEVERPDPRVPSEVFTRLFERYVATDGGTGVT